MNDDVVLVDPSGVPSMAETMALINNTVGVDETSEPQVCDGVTILDVRAGLVLSVVNDDVALVDPNGVPSMVSTMALIDDTVGVDETSKP